MNDTTLRLVGAGLFFVFIILTGFWLSRTGKPYKSLILNIHKLIALAAVVVLIITIVKVSKVTPLDTLAVIAVVVTGVLGVTMFATGGLVSGLKTVPSILLTLHHVMPYLAVLSTAGALYVLLLRG